ncbi:MAG: HNH endonuclease [Bdellovibrionota bacterium]
MLYLRQMLYGFADPEHIKRERSKAQELRKSQWWKQQLGKGVCYHCGEKFSKELLTMDHLIPVARGGKSTKKNVVVACKPCNSEKGHKMKVEQVMDEMIASGQLGDEIPEGEE